MLLKFIEKHIGYFTVNQIVSVGGKFSEMRLLIVFVKSGLWFPLFKKNKTVGISGTAEWTVADIAVLSSDKSDEFGNALLQEVAFAFSGTERNDESYGFVIHKNTSFFSGI